MSERISDRRGATRGKITLEVGPDPPLEAVQRALGPGELTLRLQSPVLQLEVLAEDYDLAIQVTDDPPRTEKFAQPIQGV